MGSAKGTESQESEAGQAQGQMRQSAELRDWNKGVKPKKAFMYQSILASARNFESYDTGVGL